MSPLTNEVRTLSRVLSAELLRHGAIIVDLNNPFRLASGNYSPIYVNCRKVISSPPTIQLITAISMLQLELTKCQFDVVAGGETAGIPFAAFLAAAFNKPMIYVRKTPKGHGLPSSIEGTVEQTARVLLVEDLITDGLSKIQFIKSIRESGAVVEDSLVVLDRGQGGALMLMENRVRLIALTDMESLIQVASEWGLLPATTITSIREYLTSPAEWHERLGLPFLNNGD